MIPIKRGTEPSSLEPVREKQLDKLRNLGRTPKSDDIDGYRIVSEELWRAQYRKCCYCEQRIKERYNDVEHYRPKAEAQRGENFPTYGYWWLAFTWSNLLFACPSCNRSGKNSDFPLIVGSAILQVGDDPADGEEEPLLLDPAGEINPVKHIQFTFEFRPETGTHWYACPRNKSKYGKTTIKVCDLNSKELLELRDAFFEATIEPQITALQRELMAKDVAGIEREFNRASEMLTPRNEFVGLCYDAFCTRIPSEQLKQTIGKGWPATGRVGKTR